MKMKKIIPLLIVTSIFLTSCLPETNEITDNLIEEEPIIEEEPVIEEDPVLTAVKATVVEPSIIYKQVSYNGKFEPGQQVSIAPKLSGTVTSTYKDVGDSVKTGDKLFTLDDTDVKLSIKQAQAQVDSANIAVTQAENSKLSITGAQYKQTLLQLDSTMENLQNQIDSANDAVDIAETTYNNSKTLYDSGVMSKVEFDQAELSYTQALNQVEALKAQLKQAKQSYELTKSITIDENLGTAEIGVQQAKAALDSAKLSLESAQKNLDYITPTTPISGVVSTKNIAEDQITSAGSVAYIISNIDSVMATINVTENVINKISIGDALEVTVDSLGQVFEGKVTQINPIADQTSTYPVKITIDNPDNLIKPGMFCDVTIITDGAFDTIVVPREALLRDMDQSYVYTVDVFGVVSAKYVETGIDNGDNIQILSGLEVGDRVITEGQTYVTDGEQVNVVQ